MTIQTKNLPLKEEGKSDEKLTEELIEDFNAEAKKQKSKWIMYIKYDCSPYLCKRKFIFENYSVQLFLQEGNFIFLHPIDERTLKEIKPIADKIKQNLQADILPTQ